MVKILKLNQVDHIFWANDIGIMSQIFNFVFEEVNFLQKLFFLKPQ